MDERNGFKHTALYAKAHRTHPFFFLFILREPKEKKEK
jgi:hypothetical protein